MRATSLIKPLPLAAVLLATLLMMATVSLAEERAGFTAAGAIAPAKLVSITSEGGLVLEAAGKSTTYTAQDIVYWGSNTEAKRGPVVLLSDGSALIGDPIALNSEELRIDTRLVGELALPRNVVRGIIFRLPADVKSRDALHDRILNRRDANDWLLLANGDELTGRATGQKTAEQSAEEQLMFAVGMTKAPASLGFSKLAAIAFDSVLVDSVARRGNQTLTVLRDGSQLYVGEIAERGPRQELTLVCGAKVRLDRESLGEDVVFWQPLGGTTTYLSDLDDAGYKHIPFLTQSWSFGRDRNCHGERLRSAGALIAKGLGMRSTSRLAYDLPEDYRTFAAELALDDSAGERGSVIFRVFTAAETGAWKTAYESPVIRGGTSPLPISVDIRGAKRLALIVDFAERGDECDDADWLNARLSR